MLLPDGERIQADALAAANGDPVDLIDLLETFHEDSARRHQAEEAVQRVLSGTLPSWRASRRTLESWIEAVLNRIEVCDEQ